MGPPPQPDNRNDATTIGKMPTANLDNGKTQLPKNAHTTGHEDPTACLCHDMKWPSISTMYYSVGSRRSRSTTSIGNKGTRTCFTISAIRLLRLRKLHFAPSRCLARVFDAQHDSCELIERESDLHALAANVRLRSSERSRNGTNSAVLRSVANLRRVAALDFIGSAARVARSERARGVGPHRHDALA